MGSLQLTSSAKTSCRIVDDKSKTLKMKWTLPVALVCVCVGLASSKGDIDLYWDSSTWQTLDDAPSIQLYLQVTTQLVDSCLVRGEDKTGCEITIKYRRIDSEGSTDGDLTPGPWSSDKKIGVNTAANSLAPLTLQNLAPGAYYQVVLADPSGEQTQYFIQTVASRDAPNITKYKRGYKEQQEKKKLLKRVLEMLLQKKN